MAGITETLASNFATHGLHQGTDVSMVMKLFGHEDLNATFRYLPVTNREILKVLSPLDNLNHSSNRYAHV